jgi:hypothetical protein
MQTAGAELTVDAERYAEADDSVLSITHLQLASVPTNAMLGAGLSTIADVLIFAATPKFSGYVFRGELAAALQRLAICTTGNVVDWRKYWNEQGREFHHLSASLPELDRMSPWSASLPVTVESFGKAALPLSRAGYTTLGQLRDGLLTGISHVHGLGRGRRAEFFECLLRIADSVDAAGDVRDPAWRMSHPAATGQALSPRSDILAGAISDGPSAETFRSALPPEVAKLSIGVLHLGQKTIWITQAGYHNVGQLAAEWPIGPRQIQNIGPTTINLIGQRLSALSASLNGGEVDWDRYCELTGIQLVPASPDAEEGAGFLHSLPAVLSEIARVLDDALDAAILLRRIARPPGEQDTLEDLAQFSASKVTRERVRQRERRLLTDLSRGLMWDDYGSLALHFRPSFSRWWKEAAGRFRDIEDITFADFIEGLSEVWGVNHATVMEQAPIIMAIVTRDAQMPASFRSGFRLDPRLYGVLPASTLEVRLSRLRLGKYAADLAEYGVTTPRDIIALCRAGRIADIESRASREALAHLNVLAGCLDSEGAIDWSAYRAVVGLRRLPDASPASPLDFVSGLSAHLAALVSEAAITPRAADIFRLRSARAYHERLTLQEIADRLDTHGPTIKREETILLEFLNDLVIDREFTNSPVWLDEAWLGYWSTAQDAYGRAGGDVELFARDLAGAWQLPASALDQAAPALWSVLSGYPDGRRIAPRRSLPAESAQPAHPAGDGRIRLVGFRRLH